MITGWIGNLPAVVSVTWTEQKMYERELRWPSANSLRKDGSSFCITGKIFFLKSPYETLRDNRPQN